MKEELKTLKDIIWGVNHDECRNEDTIVISSGMLKQEAIKWIKEIDTNPDVYTARFTEWHEGDDKPSGWVVINWIKHFFNITEEDLK